MSAANAIRRAVPILAQYGNAEIVLLPWLLRSGLSKLEAVAAIRFVPLALGRAILLEGLGMTLADSYVLVNQATGAREEKSLADEKFFMETMNLAPALGAEFGIDVVSTVALLSSEVQAVNEALNAGSKAEDLVGSLPLMKWEE